MDYKQETEKAVAFLDAVRTAIDNAELGVVMGWKDERAGVILTRATCQMEVAARNLEFVIHKLQLIARMHESEQKYGATVDGVSARGTVVPESQVGRDSIPQSAASPG